MLQPADARRLVCHLVIVWSSSLTDQCLSLHCLVTTWPSSSHDLAIACGLRARRASEARRRVWTVVAADESGDEEVFFPLQAGSAPHHHLILTPSALPLHFIIAGLAPPCLSSERSLRSQSRSTHSITPAGWAEDHIRRLYESPFANHRTSKALLAGLLLLLLLLRLIRTVFAAAEVCTQQHGCCEDAANMPPRCRQEQLRCMRDAAELQPRCR